MDGLGEDSPELYHLEVKLQFIITNLNPLPEHKDTAQRLLGDNLDDDQVTFYLVSVVHADECFPSVHEYCTNVIT